MSRRATEFQTIRSEGGLLPPDLLRRVVDPACKVAGVEPTAYGLPAGERLNEAITQSWNRLCRHWAEFRGAAKDLPAGDATTGLTNDKWSLPLLRELGFGFLTTTAGPTIDGKTYAISRFSGNTAIHLVGCGVSLDHRAAGVRGAAAGNPHGLVQEFLNRSPGHLWAIVSNGISFRILRDNQALSRQSFLEFDLEAMFDGEVYSDFVLLWLIAHATRFLPRNDGRPDSCWLETWSKEAAEQGVAALTDLRGGVEKALEILGQGFVSHPKNTALRDALRKGDVKLSDFHHQLLRVVYRLIFLFVSEDRELEGISILHPQDKSEKARLARERYAAHYSTSRLRELASRIKGSRHGDLWRQFQLLVGALSGEERFAGMRGALALPPLGSMLWNPASTALLNGPGLSDPGTELSNVDFLEALRHLAFIRKDKILRPVDYKNLGSEEFGGVYESFLALTPQISGDGARFTFAEFAGNERKTSGSYYTPDSLVQCLLDSALDPVVNERLADAERLAKADWPAVEKEIQSDPAKRTYVLAFLTKHAGASKTATAEERKRAWDSVPPTLRRWNLSEEAILAIKVCDKACGSGHFLVGAGHRLARHLARVRALAQGESEPSPLLYQTALRDVIGHCLYGVDINPMAVELCKVTLWLEAMEPGKPLSFLDHHIRCGNSLLGATPELIAAGLPDEAFEPVEGDDREACARLKKLNRAQRDSLKHLFLAEDNAIRDQLRQAAAAIDEIGDQCPEDIHRKETAFRSAESNYDLQKARTIANLWCAAFAIKKRFKQEQTPQQVSPPTALPVDGPTATPLPAWFGVPDKTPKPKQTKTQKSTQPHSAVPVGITTQHLHDFVEGGELPEGMVPEAESLDHHFHFFHWHLAFPEVFANGGFDLNLGNPPWVRQEMLKPIKQFLPKFGSFSSTADSSVYFIELSVLTCRPRGRVAMLTPNKWFRASYAENLRKFLRERCHIALLIDFGHSRNLFPDADTFPAAVVLQPVVAPVSDSETARFVHAHDSDRDQQPLPELIRTRAVMVPHANLRPDRWHLEGFGASNLLNRLMATGQPLEPLLRRSILSGLKTGFNEAFYVESPSRKAMLAADPASDILFKRFLRGRDVKRWLPFWDDQWHIVIPSSQNRSWPWSNAANEIDAETIFAATHPSVHAHLKQFEQPLRARQDKGKYWWELRACDYYEDFEKPKIIVQCIAYYSQFAFDEQGLYVNNKAIVIPTDDLYLLAILNSRIVWWIVNRTFQHMKDEGLSVDVQFLKRLPVPTVGEPLRSEIQSLAAEIVTASNSPTGSQCIPSLEVRLNDLVMQAFALTEAEQEILVSSLPPRDPIAELGAMPPAVVETLAQPTRFDRERINFNEPGDYILAFVGSLLRHQRGECDLMKLIRAYAMLLGDRRTFSTLAEARFGAEAGAWVKRFNQTVEASWFLPVIRGLDNRDVLKLEERGETDVFVRLLDASVPSNATVETDVYLLLQVLDLNVAPPAAVAEQVRRIAPKSVRASLHEATAIMA